MGADTIVGMISIFIYFLTHHFKNTESAVQNSLCSSKIILWPNIVILWSNNKIIVFLKSQSIIYTTIGEPSSKIDEFLAVWSQFDSDHGVDFSTPTSCQSATFVRLLFAFYCTLFFTKTNSK